MDDPTDQVASLLHQAAETHHVVYSDVDGEDDDWATFYSDWLLTHSRLGDILGQRPVRSHLTAELVSLDERFTRTQPGAKWEQYYAQGLLERFAA
jgi:hypothetical protein